MNNFWEIAPWLAPMGLLICLSAFFSASEAALFYLRPSDRRALRSGSAGQRLALSLLGDPDRLLSAVLFWNLVVNISYFALASIVALQLERGGAISKTWAFVFALLALLAIIFFSEMMPKSLAVLKPRWLAGWISWPLVLAVRAIDPLMPLLRWITVLTRRSIWPRFESEPYLDISDLERAIDLSVNDARLIKQEQAVLQNIVQLSDIRIDEWMRPRTQLMAFRPPVRREELLGKHPPSGYLLITEHDSEEIGRAIRLDRLAGCIGAELDRVADPVLYLPWCATVADALEKLTRRDREVAAVVNEFGETIGVLTMDDIVQTLFAYSPSRSQRLLNQQPLKQIEPGLWRVSGMMGLRQLARRLSVTLPATHSVTVAGVIQQTLQRLAAPGDRCQWGPFRFAVVHAARPGPLVVDVELVQAGDADS